MFVRTTGLLIALVAVGTPGTATAANLVTRWLRQARPQVEDHIRRLGRGQHQLRNASRLLTDAQRVSEHDPAAAIALVREAAPLLTEPVHTTLVQLFGEFAKQNGVSAGGQPASPRSQTFVAGGLARLAQVGGPGAGHAPRKRAAAPKSAAEPPPAHSLEDESNFGRLGAALEAFDGAPSATERPEKVPEAQHSPPPRRPSTKDAPSDQALSAPRAGTARLRIDPQAGEIAWPVVGGQLERALRRTSYGESREEDPPVGPYVLQVSLASAGERGGYTLPRVASAGLRTADQRTTERIELIPPVTLYRTPKLLEALDRLQANTPSRPLLLRTLKRLRGAGGPEEGRSAAQEGVKAVRKGTELRDLPESVRAAVRRTIAADAEAVRAALEDKAFDLWQLSASQQLLVAATIADYFFPHSERRMAWGHDRHPPGDAAGREAGTIRTTKPVEIPEDVVKGFLETVAAMAR